MYLNVAGVFLFVYGTGYCFPTSEYENTPCKNKDRTAGICKPVTKCLPAVEQIKQIKKHEFRRCGFDDLIEIVCCPKSAGREPLINTGREPPIQTHSHGHFPIDEYPDYTDDNLDKNLNNRRPTSSTPRDVEVNNENRGNQGVRKAVRACQEFSNEVQPTVTYHIIGGENASLGEFPHMAALGYEEDGSVKWKCGASLISKRYLVTAAHCIIDISGIKPTKVRMGVIDITLRNKSIPVQDYDVEESIPHPEYNISARIHDIGLIKLRRDVQITKLVRPACLYIENDDPNGLIVSGWGITAADGTEQSDILLKATLTPYPRQDCDKLYKARISKRIISAQICAVDNSSDTCKGDSGGPLQIENKKTNGIYSIVGVSAYGINCGGNTPGVYTRISEYLDWIERIVWS